MSKKNEKISVAIIGSGISGASCAYFLSELFESNIEIDVYEKSDVIGGRLATFEYRGREYETGGSILHPTNFYMSEFTRICGFEKLIESKRRNYFLGLFNSKSIVFSSASWDFDRYGVVEKLNFIKHFGFFEVIRFFRWLWALVKDFERIYKLQDDGRTFHTVEEFLKMLSGDLYEASRVSTRRLLEREQFSAKVINELANVSTLANYGQDINASGFVGLVSLAAVSAELWCVKGGNKQIPIALLKKSNANVILNAEVSSIGAQSKASNSLVFSKDGKEFTKEYSYIVVACPLTKSSKMAVNFDYKDHLNCELHFNQATLVDGNVHVFPDIPLDKRIELFSCDPSVDCRIICTQLPCDYSEDHDGSTFTSTKVYKTFSPYDLSDNMTKKVFKPGYKLLHKSNWLAFPKYETAIEQSYPGLHIDSRERSRVFYSNSIEWAASCMELCCISSRNIALLISEKEKNVMKRRLFKTNTVIKSNNTYSILVIIVIIIVSTYYYSLI